ncbi:hypothetical protein C6V83_18015 [Gordonia iterans]|uniref:Uncharacterized protein n=2 Tax=Gordonia iterans TaxID=1004901 RepID=A0A2S0KJL8_9ACTN|nr:hypothetical protein C6V83_18015 [Gordonia iterans]
MQAQLQVSGGKAGSKGSNGSSGSNGVSYGSNGGNGGSGQNGGNGTACVFGGVSSCDGTEISNGKTSFGVTTFDHGLGLPNNDGGVALYLQW